jgi:hypothetical protein
VRRVNPRIALWAGIVAVGLGLITTLLAAVQGSRGGATAFIGFGLTLLGALVAAALGLITVLNVDDPAAKKLALWGLGLGLGAPVLTAGLLLALVPSSAFRI